ncbi:hypothetical protein [Nitrincola sp. MINF-07-Sa-05]|uniref:hypothetical protein n=1 Tax=Nitrincola salilacus TaxID=3400273 RepID=UPI00391855D3
MEGIDNRQYSGLASYQEYQFSYYRENSIFTTLIIADFGVSIWILDYVWGSAGAEKVLWWPIAILAMTLPYLIALKCKWNYSVTFFCAAITILSWEVGYINVLNQLDVNVEYGLVGFILFVLMPPLMMMGFSLTTNINMMAIIVGLPVVYASLGYAHQLDLMRYLVLIIPLSIISVVANYILIKLYYIRREY